jgi:glycosyltransferase involved in cell wall biosynthesis
VAADRGGNRELVHDGKTGFLVKPEDPEALAVAIKKAMELSAEEASKIIKNACDLVRDQHNQNKYLESLENIYQEIINEKKSPK